MDNVKVGDKIICQRIEIPDWMHVTKGRSYEVRGFNFDDDGEVATEYWIENDKGERISVLAKEWSLMKPGYEIGDDPKIFTSPAPEINQQKPEASTPEPPICGQPQFQKSPIRL